MVHTIESFRQVECADVDRRAITNVLFNNISDTIYSTPTTEVFLESKLMG